MMTLTQLIKLVLDQAYADMPCAAEGEKDEQIKGRLEMLSSTYRGLTRGPHVPIDYADPVTRFAYIYRYTIAHADYVMQLIRRHATLARLFDGPEATVSCLGGGPGSDFLGVMKHMLLGRKKGDLTCYIFDRERAWGDSWSDVAKVLDADFRVFPVFQQLDVTSVATWQAYHKYLKADLFTLSFFLSEVWKIRSHAQPYFDHCLAKAKRGALFLYVDNNAPEFYGWFDGLAAKHGIQQLHADCGNMAFSNEEEKTDLGRYYEKFGWPKRESDVAFRVGIKN
jgi:hypothetical protein